MWTNPAEGGAKLPSRGLKRGSTTFPSAQADAACVLHTWAAEGSRPTHHLIFIHGAISHCGRHANMFEWMVRLMGGRLAVHGLDLVGHGLATGPRAFVESFQVYQEDLLTAMAWVRGQWPDGHLVLMGHSMGGLVALKTLLQLEQRLPAPVDGLLLSNPCIRPHKVVDFPRALDVLEGLSRRVPYLRFPRTFKASELAYSAEAANQFDTDPLIPPFMTARMVHELWIAAQEVRALSYFVKLPTLFLLSAEDQIVDRAATLLFARGIDKRWVEVLEYPEAKHELLNEVVAPRVWADAGKWLAARMEPL